MKKANKQQLLLLVARQAVLTASTLAPAQRADLFEGSAFLLPHKEAEAARHAAFLLRESERQQASFVHLLFSSSELNPKP